MDPVSQGVLGAAAALFISRKSDTKQAAVVGALGGMAPDLDILFRSSQDPLMALELHRQFTHSLAFIPFGGAIVALFLWVLFYRQHTYREIWLFATIGYATHGLLDACTSYGTQLYWPFSDFRVAWDVIGIIDLLVTVPLLIAVIATAKSGHKRWLITGTTLVAMYFGLGVSQHQRAMDTIEQIAGDAGQRVVRAKAMPTVGNLIVWRTIYQADNSYHVNAIALPLFSEPRVYSGGTVKPLDVDKDFPSLPTDSLQADDIERFRWFTSDWLFVSPTNPSAIGDLRYAGRPDGIQSLWQITVSPEQPDEHVGYGSKMRDSDGLVLLDMLLDREVDQ